MTAEFKILFALLSATVILPLSSAAQQQRGFAFGGTWSSRQCGISASISPEAGLFNEISISADLWDVLDGSEGCPGLIASYDRIYSIQTWSHRDSDISLFIGPGYSAGWVLDRGKDWGWLAGMDVIVGIMASFRTPVDLCFGFKAILGLHADVNSTHNSTLTFYKNGYQRAYLPELRIRYRF